MESAVAEARVYASAGFHGGLVETGESTPNAHYRFSDLIRAM